MVLAHVQAWAAVALIVFGVYRVARQSLVDEIRHHVMGVAIAVAAAVDANEIDGIRQASDASQPAFVRIQSLLGRVRALNPDVTYLYVMRRSPREGAAPHEHEYVVDAPAQDRDDNGTIDAHERSEAPGTAYDASAFEEMIRAWTLPTADRHITSDPPYPDLLSGYSPILDSEGRTVAIVGVDIIAQTISNKLRNVRLGSWAAGALLGMLLSGLLSLYNRVREALRVNQELAHQLAAHNAALHEANEQLAANNRRFRDELQLAQIVQQGFLPTIFPRQDRVSFEKFYLTCEAVGGDLYDVYEVDAQHIAFYVADVSGHGVSAAMVSGLLKMAMNALRDLTTEEGHRLMLQPDMVLTTLNTMISPSLPADSFITILYGIADLQGNRLRMANGGHPDPMFFRTSLRTAETVAVPSGGAIGMPGQPHFHVSSLSFAAGDKLLLYTDGLTEAMNAEGDEFGPARLQGAFERSARESPRKLIDALRDEVRLHCNGVDFQDDFTLLVAEFR